MKVESQRKPPLRKDQHPFLALTLPIHFAYLLSGFTVAVTKAESTFFTLTQPVQIPIMLKEVFS